MALPQLYIYPVVTAVIFPVTFALTYTIAVVLNHTELDWPYISDTSTQAPESCIFSQLVNIGALFIGITFYIRYKQVSEFCSSHQLSSRLRQVNWWSLLVGWAAAAGVSLCANFQETEMFSVHLTGALLGFGLGTVYLWSQVFTSWVLYPLANGKFVFVVRAVLATVNLIGFFVMLISGVVANHQFHGKDPTKWYPEDGGWVAHIVSTASEWTMAFAFDIFLLTFVPEFKKLALESPRISLRIDPDSSLLEINSSFEEYHQSNNFLA